MGTKVLDNVSETFFIAVSMMTAILVRWSVASGSYSGMGKTPKFGDYEAQRHWQEITVNTPIKEWYRNTSDNDLLYWGLDYPPLSAYHSWLLGKIAELIHPDWVALHKSRGMESYHHKLFMRHSVLFMDLLLFFPILYYFHQISGQRRVQREALLEALFYPGLILIDYGHFQYNNVSLGFFLLATCFLRNNRNILGAVAFVLALNYKHMELYHSIPFFCYLLGSSMKSGFFPGLFNVVKLGVIVLATFAVCWLPFLTSIDDMLAVVNRLFPVNRGLYEDKVANFWCSISPLLKLKEIMSPDGTVKMCIAATLLASLPSALHLLRRPTNKAFQFSCVTVPLAFFLFSFQVHEKSILIPAVSACLVYTEAPFLVGWFLHMSTFSMVPLLRKDGLMIGYYATRYMFVILTYAWDSQAAKPSGQLTKLLRCLLCNTFHQSTIKKALQIMIIISTIFSEVLTLLLFFAKPPERLPDLWAVGISAFSCLHFLVFLVLFTGLQFRFGGETVTEAKKKT